MQNDKQSHQQPLQTPPSHSTTIKTSEEWKTYWKAQGQEWHTEPEISAQRQAKLAHYRTITPDIKKGVYPFGGVKLNRADIEWLLATHENGRGPVIWSDETQRTRKGLDLRGADLRGDEAQNLNLEGLPLSRLIGGVNTRLDISETQQEQASIHLEGADLNQAHLEGAYLRYAHLEGADLNQAHLEGANLNYAHLEGANLFSVHLEGAEFNYAHLEGADLNQAHLEGVYLRYAHLEGANLNYAHLEGAYLNYTHLEGANLTDIYLADIQHIGPFLADSQWGSCNLTVVDWPQVSILRDEYVAMQEKSGSGDKKDKGTRLYEYKTAVRANRQLSVVLQSQGLNEDASRFAYRAQALQKEVFWFRIIQDKTPFRTRFSLLGSWLFSWFMFLIAGYGYRFGRTFVTYLAVISGFATMYYFYGANDLDAHNKPGPHHLSWYEALIVSMTAFHGRGFFVGTFSPGDPQALVAAIEAFFGLLIEVIFIATLTRRLFTQ